MPAVVFDIETVGDDFELLDDASKEFFLKNAETKEEIVEAKESLNFSPLTAQIVAIGMLDVETDKGVVYFQNGDSQYEKFVEGDITYISANEKEILNLFWNQISRYNQFITFNGRTFDCPFLMIRSAIHQIKATKNLVPYRYSVTPHVDLADQLSFYDALRRKFSLHMWCRAFNIASPKEEGISGADVKGLYKKGKYTDIARYCMRDIQATKKLFFYWDKYLKFDK